MTPLTDIIIDPICSMREQRKVGENAFTHFIKSELASRILAVTTPIFASFEIFMQVMEVLIVNPLALLGTEVYCALTRSDPSKDRKSILSSYKHALSRIAFCAAMVFLGPTVGAVYPKAFEMFSVTQFKKDVKRSNCVLSGARVRNPEESVVDSLIFIDDSKSLKDYKYLPYVDPDHWNECKRYVGMISRLSSLDDPRLVRIFNYLGIQDVLDTRDISNIKESCTNICKVMERVEEIGIIG